VTDRESAESISRPRNEPESRSCPGKSPIQNRASIERGRSLTLVVTDGCNLQCSYCNVRNPRGKSMTWQTAKAAADWLISENHRSPELRFYGGEPTLEPELLQRCSTYLVKNARKGQTPRFHLTTNGTLIDSQLLEWLAVGRVRISLSADGVREAQALRSSAHFDGIHRLFQRIRSQYADTFRNFLSVRITLNGANLPYLVRSIRYFLKIGLRQIEISPIVTHDPSWGPSKCDDLHKKMSEIADLSLQHYAVQGEIPVAFLRTPPPEPSSATRWRAVCGIGTTRDITVDVDGEVFACRALVRSGGFVGQGLSSVLSEKGHLGKIHDGDFESRLANCRQEMRRHPLVKSLSKKHSNDSRCATCEFIGSCRVCAVSIGNIPGNQNSNRIPDLACSFNRACGASSRSFWDAINY